MTNSLRILAAALSLTAGVAEAQNYAIQFDGVDDYVNLGYGPDFDLTSSLTLECRMRLDTVLMGGYHSMVYKGDYEYGLQMYASQLRAVLLNGVDANEFGYLVTPSNFLPDTGIWYHVAMTFDGLEERLYVNGDSISSIAATAPIPSSVDSVFAAKAYGGNAFFKGKLDEVRFWNVTRSQAEIQATMTTTLNGNEPGLVAYYPFDEGSGTTATDASLNGNDATLVNGAQWVDYYDNVLHLLSVSDSTFLPGEQMSVDYSVVSDLNTGNQFILELSDAGGAFSNAIVLTSSTGSTSGSLSATLPMNLPAGCGYKVRVRSTDPALIGVSHAIQIGDMVSGDFNYALKFDGVDDYADLGTWFTSSDFTISFWVKPDSTNPDFATMMDFQPDFFVARSPGIQNNYFTQHPLAAFDLLPNRWNHLTISFDALTGERRVYLFGQLIDTQIKAFATQPGYDWTLGNVLAGWVGTYTNFKGLIDELKVWDHRLDSAEVLQQVQMHLTGNEPGLLAYYDFNEGCSSEVVDVSGQQPNGTLNGGADRVISDVPVWSTNIVPDHGGNTNVVSVTIFDLIQAAPLGARLIHAGFSDVLADTVFVSLDSTSATVFFDLTGRDTGLYALELALADTTVKYYPNSFTVEEGVAPQVWVDIIGRNHVRNGQPFTFLVNYGNTGNVDAKGVPLWIEIEGDSLIDIRPNFRISTSSGYDFSAVLDSLPWYFVYDTLSGVPGEYILIPLYLPTIPGGTIGTLSFTLSNITDSITIRTYTTLPYYQSPLSDLVKDCLSAIVQQRLGQIIDETIEDIIVDLELPPGIQCLRSAYETITNIKTYRKNNAGVYTDVVVDGPTRGSIAWDLAGTIFTCVADFCPTWKAVKVVAKIVEAINEFREYLETAYACMPAEEPQQPPVEAPLYPILSFDPNEKVGPRTFQNVGHDFSYGIFFENLAEATAAAQQVVVIDTLDATHLDLSTFSFGGFGFGQAALGYVGPVSQSFTQIIDLRPETDLIVGVRGNLDESTGVAVWRFTSLDPLTLELTEDPLLGFLPPNDSTGRGQGFVAYTIKPFGTLANGDSIKNCATIYFDYNAPIATNCWQNVIDIEDPVCAVDPLAPVQNVDTFLVTWQGTDNLSGIASYDVDVSTNGGPYRRWLDHHIGTSAYFQGAFDSTYTFYSLATDSAGNIEDPPVGYDAITQCLDISTSVMGLNGSGMSIAVVPNPNDGSFVLRLFANDPANARVMVTDLMGQMVYEGAIQLQKGSNSRPYSFGSLPAGLYSLKLRAPDWETNTRFVKE